MAYPQHIRDLISQARNTWIGFVTTQHLSNFEHEREARKWFEDCNAVARELDLNWADARKVILCQ